MSSNNKKFIPTGNKPTVKIILVGSSGVGKTCLASSFLRQTFDCQTLPTVAPAYSCIDVTDSKGRIVSLQIWDTAGQERYHSVSQLFYRDSDVALVCFEIGDDESTAAIPEWIQKVKNEVPDCILFFVGTKSDLKTQEEIEKAKEEIAHKFSSIGHKGIFVTSAKNRIGLNEVFNETADFCVIEEDTQRELKPSEGDKKCC